MKETTSAEIHLKEKKELTDKLAAVGAPIAEEDRVVTLLGSLPKKYSTLVTALEARGNDLSLSYVQQALIHEELKMSENTAVVDTTVGEQKALVGRQSRQQMKSYEYQSRQPVKCNECGEVGYIRRYAHGRKQFIKQIQ